MGGTILDGGNTMEIDVDARGAARPVAIVTGEVQAAPRGRTIRLVSQAPLGAGRARELFAALRGSERRFVVRLALSAIERDEVIEEARRAGCIALEVEREEPLRSSLGSGIDRSRRAVERLMRALRRTRGLGVATIAHLPLGLAGDDEGVFERAVAFCRGALISVPCLTLAPESESPTAPPATVAADADSVRAIGADPSLDIRPRMRATTAQNGLRWATAALASHGAIWRRALWPSGASRLALAAGYAARRHAAQQSRGRYTPTMDLLHRLNRTVRARSRSRFLVLLGAPVGSGGESIRRAWLRTRAASDEPRRALLIEIDGALDLRGARSLLRRIGHALQGGYQRVVIDVRGVEAVSLDVLTRFIDENRARLREVADRTRLVNLREPVEHLRRELGDLPSLRLLEAAVLA